MHSLPGPKTTSHPNPTGRGRMMPAERSGMDEQLDREVEPGSEVYKDTRLEVGTN